MSLVHLYTPRYGGSPDMTRCRAHVSEGWHGTQCTRAPKVERDGVKYCAQHDPVAVEARYAARDAKWAAKWKQEQTIRDRDKALAAFKCEAVEALRLIADGHNDARGLAQELLAKEPT